VIHELVKEALGMPAIFDLIGISGAFMTEQKRLWQKGELPLPSYAAVGDLMQDLKAQPALKEKGKSLLEHLPHVPNLYTDHIYSITELFHIKEFLYHYGRLQLLDRREGLFGGELIDLDEVFKYLDPQGSGSPAFHLNPAFSAHLGEIFTRERQLETALQKSMQAHFETALKQLNLKATGYQIVVPRSDKALCERIMQSSHWVLVSESVANLRFSLADDEESLKLKKQLQDLEQDRTKEEDLILKKISLYIEQQVPRIQEAVALLSLKALSFILAEFGAKYDCIIPELNSQDIRIKAAVNLPLKLYLQAEQREYQPIDLCFEPQGNVITGPNMGGKSCALQTLGQLVAMTHYHIPLPCKSAQITTIHNIWLNHIDSTRSSDLSSFGAEVVAFNEAIEQEGISLILLDEFARGTNPAEGEKLLCAVLEYLSQSPHFVVAATHYTKPALMGHLAQFTILGPQLDSLSIPRSAKQRLKLLAQKMDYRLKRLDKGQLPPQSAIAIAKLLGLKQEILSLIDMGD
jgi:DNA mismatch repair protein MutS2